MRKSVGLTILGLVMLAVGVATRAAGAPVIVFAVFLALTVLCPLAGLPFMIVGARKNRENNERILREVREEVRQRKGKGSDL
jgi:hypothetical protein